VDIELPARPAYKSRTSGALLPLTQHRERRQRRCIARFVAVPRLLQALAATLVSVVTATLPIPGFPDDLHSASAQEHQGSAGESWFTKGLKGLNDALEASLNYRTS
jgi:hypothetical protein